MNKVLVIVGPTASGKTAVAIKIAKHINGEIISADSRQVYRGLDIGSGKVTPQEMQGINHHLIDVASPGEYFSVEDFRTLGNQALTDISERSKIPIICGGSGFYIDSLVFNKVYPAIDPKVKKDLQNLDITSLQELAKAELPAIILDKIDMNNPVRLRSRLGLWRTHGELPQPNIIKRDLNFDFIWLGLDPDKTVLNENITKRTNERIESGLVAEVQSLLNDKVSSRWLYSLGMEYQLTTEHLVKGKADIEQLKQQIITADLQYAKRQMTWFKKNQLITWFNNPADLVKHVKCLVPSA